ncbi:MAG: hypothetical protein MR936_12495 [Eubacterium sp.]|nr:hypothetical protein [Eubacterium sp.]
MVDIHAHVLPGLDDGPGNIEISLKMIKMAADNNVNHIVATSHGNYYPYGLDEYWVAFGNLKEELKNYNIPVTVYPGMEIYMDDSAINMIESKKVLSINRSDYILVEFPFDEYEENVKAGIEMLLNRKYRVILAHPERYIFFQRSPGLAYNLEKKGCIMQMNQGSLLGYFGGECNRLALRMLNDGIIHMIATDAHDLKYRSYDLRRLMLWLQKYYQPELIHLWLSENPSRILKGYDIIRLLKKDEE